MLGGIAAIMQYNKSSSTVRSELTNFTFEDTASIQRITLKSQSGELVELRRKKNNNWQVNGERKARPDAVENLLTTIKKLSVKTPVSQVAMENILKQIIASHTFVEIYTDDSDPIKSYYVGGGNQDHTGTFMMMKGSTRPFVMHIEGFHGFLTPRYFTNASEWQSREVFEYSPEEIARIELKYSESEEKNWVYENKGLGNILVLKGAQLETSLPFDTLLLNGYLRHYAMIHYESYEETKPESFIDSVKNSTPVFSIELTTSNGENRIIHGYRKPIKDGYSLEGNPIQFDQDRLYIWVDSNEFHVAQYAIFDKLTKGVYFFP